MICIVGLGPTHDLVPWEEHEVWGLPWDPWAPRYDVLFEMHSPELFRQRGEEYISRINDTQLPVYMQEKQEDIPLSASYPMSEVSSLVGDYYGSSVAYMLGLSILMGHDVSLYGVDLSDDYDHQRPNLEYLIGFARGRGLRIDVPEGSLLLKRRKYDSYQGVTVIYPKRYGAV